MTKATLEDEIKQRHISGLKEEIAEMEREIDHLQESVDPETASDSQVQKVMRQVEICEVTIATLQKMVSDIAGA